MTAARLACVVVVATCTVAGIQTASASTCSYREPHLGLEDGAVVPPDPVLYVYADQGWRSIMHVDGLARRPVDVTQDGAPVPFELALASSTPGGDTYRLDIRAARGVVEVRTSGERVRLTIDPRWRRPRAEQMRITAASFYGPIPGVSGARGDSVALRPSLKAPAYRLQWRMPAGGWSEAVVERVALEWRDPFCGGNGIGVAGIGFVRVHALLPDGTEIPGPTLDFASVLADARAREETWIDVRREQIAATPPYDEVSSTDHRPDGRTPAAAPAPTAVTTVPGPVADALGPAAAAPARAASRRGPLIYLGSYLIGIAIGLGFLARRRVRRARKQDGSRSARDTRAGR